MSTEKLAPRGKPAFATRAGPLKKHILKQRAGECNSCCQQGLWAELDAWLGWGEVPWMMVPHPQSMTYTGGNHEN